MAIQTLILQSWHGRRISMVPRVPVPSDMAHHTVSANGLGIGDVLKRFDRSQPYHALE
jgi:hypothetical protein